MTGKQITQRREKAGLSREALADKVGVSFNTIYRWERYNVKPHSFFNTKLEEILGEK